MRDRASGAPIRGAFVTVVDSARSNRKGVLTDSVGRYVLRAPAGNTRVRVELIGYETVTRSTVVPQTGAASLDLAMGIQPITMTELHAQTTRRCTIRPEAAELTARLWDEVRKALRVASWTERMQPVRLETRSWERTLEPYSMKVLAEKTWLGESRNKAWAAIDPDTLARYGFVRKLTGDSLLYYGPDADVLLSDAFLDTHCFSVVFGVDENKGLVGLAFKPVAKRKLQDIMGTLWLDPRTSQLRYIEYGYTNQPRMYDFPDVGGETHFRRLNNGAWIVERWYIRLPEVIRMPNDYKLRAYSESGGEVIAIK